MNEIISMPNLLDGSIAIGLNAKNSWRTSIEAALFSETEKAFLASDCRAEHVRPTGSLIGSRYSEVSVISSSQGDWIIRSGAGIWHPLNIDFSTQLHYGPYKGGTRVHCPDTEAIRLSFQELYKELSGGGVDNNVFMSLRYAHQGQNFEILCPCRYLNFLNPDKPYAQEIAYVQPISGYVLFKHDQRFYQAYVAVYVDAGGVKNCEVVLRKSEYMMDLKRGVGGFATKLLSNMLRPLRKLFITDDFTYTIKFDAQLFFFRYR